MAEFKGSKNKQKTLGSKAENVEVFGCPGNNAIALLLLPHSLIRHPHLPNPDEGIA